jgi:hypothetical protein
MSTTGGLPLPAVQRKRQGAALRAQSRATSISPSWTQLGRGCEFAWQGTLSQEGLNNGNVVGGEAACGQLLLIIIMSEEWGVCMATYPYLLPLLCVSSVPDG